jgi:hypothetical protein
MTGLDFRARIWLAQGIRRIGRILLSVIVFCRRSVDGGVDCHSLRFR